MTTEMIITQEKWKKLEKLILKAICVSYSSNVIPVPAAAEITGNDETPSFWRDLTLDLLNQKLKRGSQSVL